MPRTWLGNQPNHCSIVQNIPNSLHPSSIRWNISFCLSVIVLGRPKTTLIVNGVSVMRSNFRNQNKCVSHDCHFVTDKLNFPINIFRIFLPVDSFACMECFVCWRDIVYAYYCLLASIETESLCQCPVSLLVATGYWVLGFQLFFFLYHTSSWWFYRYRIVSMEAYGEFSQCFMFCVWKIKCRSIL